MKNSTEASYTSSRDRERVSSAKAGASAADDSYELEHDIILRLPPEAAASVKQTLESGADDLKEHMSISLDSDARHAKVKLDKQVYYGKLLDLPCIAEVLKTLDRKTFYKSADVSQVLVCSSTPHEAPAASTPAASTSSEADGQSPSKRDKKKEKQFQYPHGLAPPLKNVRKRRFRRTLKKRFMDAPELEKELKRLLRADLEAASVRWELLTGESDGDAAVAASGESRCPAGDDAALARFLSTAGVDAADDDGRLVATLSALDGAAQSQTDSAPSQVPSAESSLPSTAEDCQSAALTERFARRRRSLVNQLQAIDNPVLQKRLQDEISALDAEEKEAHAD